MQIEEIKILWEGPFDIDTIINDKIDKVNEAKASDIGIYQIYGSHPLYGDGVLVYIGRTKDKNGFKKRLKDRWVIQNGNDSENVKIYLGTIMSDTAKISKKEEEAMIKKSEELLIYAMKPAYNSSNIQSCNVGENDNRFIIHNEGNYRSIYPILDSKYFLDVWKNYKLIHNLAKILGIEVDDYNGITLNEKYNISEKYIIWIGVDDEIWSKLKLPFVIEVYSEDTEVMNKIEKSIGKYYQPDADDMLGVCYLEVDSNIFSYNEKEIKVYFENKINEITKKIIL